MQRHLRRGVCGRRCMCDGRTQCMTVLLMHPRPEADRSAKLAHTCAAAQSGLTPPAGISARSCRRPGMRPRSATAGAGMAQAAHLRHGRGARTRSSGCRAPPADQWSSCAHSPTRKTSNRRARVADGLAHFRFASHLFQLSAASPRAFPVPCRFPSPQAEQSPFC